MIAFTKTKTFIYKFPVIVSTLLLIPLLIIVLVNVNTTSHYIIFSLESEKFTQSKILNILSDLNNRVNKDNFKAYLTLEPLSIKDNTFPKGSLILYVNKDNKKLVLDFIKKHNIEKFLEISKINVPTLEIKPVKFAVLESGDTFYLYNSLNMLNFAYHKITPEDIKKNALDINNFDILIIPPGTSHTIAKNLGEIGGKKIREFIEKGGNYIGICAGAYLLLSDSTHGIESLKFLKDIETLNQKPWNIGMGVLKIKMKEHPITLGLNYEELPVIYINGPIIKNINPNYNIASYLPLSSPKDFLNNLPNLYELNKIITTGIALSHIPFKKGDIILFSFHPELNSLPGTSIKLSDPYNLRLLFNAIYFSINS